VPESLVLLHGFGGTRRAWDGVSELLERERYLPLALDLPGHGAAGAGELPITFERCVADVLAQAPERFVLCGYSLGGRVALHIALSAPERVRALALISCNPGIEDESERAARLRGDLELARQLETAPFERFIERWSAQPLFAADPPEVATLALADQHRNRPELLAHVMRGLSVGAMQPLWRRLGQLRMPAGVLAGERDEKYIAIARRMAQELGDGRLVLAAGGHRLAFENPRAVAAALERLDP
jgi:2-succinyl-6-hydroxy-2,4-cyclohexadiene-1-carboxylate synthase